MREADPATLREFETWLRLFTGGDLPDRHEWKAWFCVAEYERADFASLADTLTDADSAGSFAFLGRDIADQAESINLVDEAGHEIVLHSHRHHGYSDLSYDAAHEAIATGMAAIEDATGITPRGFFPPFLDLSRGAVKAVQEVGFDWVLGRAKTEPTGVELTEPVLPFDMPLLEEHSPDEAMARLRADAEEGAAPFLFHPPVIEFYDGMNAYKEWVSAVRPTTVADQLEHGGTGVVLDCVRPVRVE